MSFLTVANVSKSFAGPPVVDGVSLEVARGEFFALLGPSGCGKSTLLKIIAGLEKADSGSLEVPRPLSMDFQSAALLPWLTVEENVAFGLHALSKSKKDIESSIKKFVNMVGLAPFASKYPRELSGGQRQRAGLARALAIEPHVLLLDEPFSALDPKTTDELHKDLLAIWKETGVTIIMVSHLLEEAVGLADRCILMKKGHVEEQFHVTLPYPSSQIGLDINEEDQKIRVIYRREDSNYGLVQIQ